MYNRLTDFLIKQKIIYTRKYQFRFRRRYSAEMALILLLDTVANAMEKKEHVL